VDVEISTAPLTRGDRTLVLITARNLSERRRAEAAIRESEERYRDLVENVDELICTHDLDGRLLSANRSLVEKSGYERPEDLIGRSLEEFLAPDVRAHFGAYLSHVIHEGRASGFMKVLTRHGEERLLEFNNILGRDAQGLPLVRGVARDVTERLRVERQLRDLNEQLERRVTERTAELRLSQERFEALARVAPVGIYRTDRWGQVTWVNDRWREITGFGPEEALGTAYLDVIHPDDLERFATGWSRGPGSPESYRIEMRLRRRDGTVAWVMNHVMADTGEDRIVRGSIGALVDITDRKRAEAEQERLATLVEKSPDLVAIFGASGHLLYMNAAGRRLLGLGDIEDVQARSGLDFLAPEGRALIESTVVPAIQERGSWDGQFTLRRAGTGEGIVVAGRCFAIHGMADGERMRVAVVARDVTEEKRAEAALRESEDQLRQAQRMEAVGRLAGGIAHDFNNLLTIILGQCEMLTVASAEDEAGRRNLDVIRDAADRAAGLTRQLLAFSRKQIMQPAVLDLNDVVRGVGSLLRRVIGEDIELSTVLGTSPGRVRADRSQLEQVIMNLAVNARDAMPHGGRLTIETLAERVDHPREPGLPPGEYAVLRLADEGTGISADVRRHIFEPFFTTKGPGKGTGLGLATAYGIVQQHGGHIAVDSAVGRGTTFRVYLPVVTESVDVAAAQGLSAPSGDETVLLVEDEADVRAVIRRLLTTLGYAVIEARGADEAVAQIEARGGVDLVLTDVVMPRRSGRALAEELWARWPGLPVIFMSGYTDEAVGHHGLVDAGALVIQKPFTRGDLGRAVRAALDQARRGA
jgi:PAS domain S-box-containing protein